MDLKKYLSDNKENFEVIKIDGKKHLVHIEVRMVLESMQGHINNLKSKINSK